MAHGAQVFDAHDVVIIEGVDPSTTQLYSGRVNGAMAKSLDADVILVTSAGDDEPDMSRRPSPSPATNTGLASRFESSDAWSTASRRGGDTDPTPKKLKSALEGHHLSLVGAVPYEAGLTWPRVLDIGREIGARSCTRVTWNGASRASPSAPRPSRGPALDSRGPARPRCRRPARRPSRRLPRRLNGMQLAGVLLTVGVEPDPAIWHIARKARETGLPFLSWTT